VGGHNHALAVVTPGKSPGIHCRGGWVIPRAVLGMCGGKKIVFPAGVFSKIAEHKCRDCRKWRRLS
jgi:hypothetical protein